MPVRFFVPGNPVPQGSKRYVGKGIMVESSKELGPWRQAIAFEATKARTENGGLRPGFVGPVRLSLVFWFHRPKGHYGTGRNAGVLKTSAPDWHSSSPDVDKLVRAVGDALTTKPFRRPLGVAVERRSATVTGVLIEINSLSQD
jgi:crossover junction endodeoxyribonuclease RusA